MGWVKVFEDTRMQYIAAVRNELDEADIESSTMNNISNLYPTLGEIEVYVKDVDVMNAKLIISKLEL